MGQSPIRELLFTFGLPVLLSAVGGAVTELADVEVPACEGLVDFFTGCQGGFSGFMSQFVVGAIPGAPASFNAVLAFVVWAARAHAIWSVVQLVRGV